METTKRPSSRIKVTLLLTEDCSGCSDAFCGDCLVINVLSRVQVPTADAA